MRTLLRSFVLFAVATLILQSCSSDDNPSNPDNGPLIDLKVGRTLEYRFTVEIPTANRKDSLFIRSTVEKDTTINNQRYAIVVDRFYRSATELDTVLLEQPSFLRVASDGLHAFIPDINQDIHVHKFPMSLNERYVFGVAPDTTARTATKVNERITVQNVSYLSTVTQSIDTTQLQLQTGFFIDAEIKQEFTLSRGFGLVKTEITITTIDNPTVLQINRQELLRIRN